MENKKTIQEIINAYSTKVSNHLKNNNILFLTGGPGTGKSSTVRELAKFYDLINVAPTKVAAMNIDGSTIHSLFRIAPGFEINDNNDSVEVIYENFIDKLQMSKLTYLQDYYESIFYEDTLLVIDEVSMISDKLLDLILHILSYWRLKSKILLVGDFYQLEPINGKRCFHSKTWKTNNIQTLELCINLRNNDKNYNIMLRNLKDGNITENLLKEFRTLNQNNVSKPTHLVGTNKLRKKINDTELALQDGDTKTYLALIRDANYFKNSNPRELIDKTKFDYELNLKVGVKVLCTVNDAFIFNGLRGTVTELHDSYIKINTSYGDSLISRIDVERKIKTKDKYGYINKTKTVIFSQFPVVLAYAVTVHKIQGASLSAMQCHIENYFTKGQLYVALSRATNPDLVKIEMNNPIRMKDIYKPEESSFFKWLSSKRWSQNVEINRNYDLFTPSKDVKEFYKSIKTIGDSNE